MVTSFSVDRVHEVLTRMVGRTLLHAIRGEDLVELVFTGGGGNLVTLFADGRMAHGFVSQELLDSGYGVGGSKW